MSQVCAIFPIRPVCVYVFALVFASTGRETLAQLAAGPKQPS